TGSLHLVSADPVPEPALDFSDARGGEAGLFHVVTQNLRTTKGKSFLLCAGKDLKSVVRDVGMRVELRTLESSLSKRQAAADTSGFFHLLPTRPLRARGKTQIG